MDDDLLGLSDIDIVTSDDTGGNGVKSATQVRRTRANRPDGARSTLKPKSKRLKRLETENEFSLGADALCGDKPPYSTVSMSQVRQSHGTNGLTVISSFSGGGGSTTGFAMSGWKELAASEFVDSAAQTFAANYPTVIITPHMVAGIVHDWVNSHPDESALLSPVFNKKKKVRGKVLPPSFSWERTQDNITTHEALEAYQGMRRWVNERAFDMIGSSDSIALWGDDVRGLDPHVLMDHCGIQPGELDCFNGSPPCKSFSMSGVREGKWGVISKYSDERQQRSDDLLGEFARLACVIQPKCFLVENVEGLGSGKAKEYALYPFIEYMEEHGYTVDVNVIRAHEHGVPQERSRMFIQGVRKDLVDSSGQPLQPAWPVPLDYTYSAREALESLPPVTGEQAAPVWIGSINEFTHFYPGTPVELVEPTRTQDLGDPDSPRFTIGKVWRTLDWGRVPKDSYFQLVRVYPDKPSPTLSAQGAGVIGAAGVTHWDEPRKFTPDELKALASFPHDYVLCGHVEQQGERIGRSVPPVMMKAIADAIATMLKDSSVTRKERMA